MPLVNWNLTWLNHNSQRPYPLTAWATGRDTTGTVQLPDDFILELDLPIHAGMNVNPEKFFLKILGVYPSGYNLGIAYDDGASRPLVAAVNIAKSTHTEYRVYAVPGVDDFADTVGKVVIGSLQGIEQVPPGQYEFDPAGGGLETDAIRPVVRGVTSIRVVNGQDRTAPLYGDIELIAGDNFRLNVNNPESNPQIVFNAISGEGLNEDCACEDDAADAPPIRTINGIPPLPNGNFRMVGDKCLEINPITNGLRFADQCSEPCCKCDQLEALITQFDRLDDGVLTLRNFVQDLRGKVTLMETSILGSTLGDQGCVSC